MNRLYHAAVRATAVLMVPASFTIGGVAYAAFRPVEPPPSLEPLPHLALPPPPAPLDLDKLQTMTTWSVLSIVPPQPVQASSKTWICERRPVFAGRLGDEVHLVGAQTVSVCDWK